MIAVLQNIYWLPLLYFHITSYEAYGQPNNFMFTELSQTVELVPGQYQITTQIVNNSLFLRFEYTNANWWAGFCIPEQTSGSMPGCDIVVVYLNDEGHATVRDMFALEFSTPTEDEQSQDWSVVNSQVETNYNNSEEGIMIGDTEVTQIASITVRRTLTTQDGQDRDILEGPMLFGWALGASSAHFTYHGEHRGIIRLQLLGNQPDSTTHQEYPEEVKTLDITADWIVDATSTTYALHVTPLPDDMQDVHIIEFEVIITEGNQPNVHHLLLFACTAEAGAVEQHKVNTTHPTTDSPVGDPECPALLHAWAVGGPLNTRLPTEAGFRIGSQENPVTPYLVLEIHYDNPDLQQGINDNSGVKIYYTPDKRQHDAVMMYMGDGLMTLPPMQRSEELSHHEIPCSRHCMEFEHPVNVTWLLLHMHNYGTRILLTRTDTGGNIEELGRIDHWNLNAQRPMSVNSTLYPKDKLSLHCTYDTSSSAPDGVRFGLSTQDEMCLAFFVYYPAVTLPKSNGPFSVCSTLGIGPDRYHDACGSWNDGFQNLLTPEATYPLKEADPPGCQTRAFGKPYKVDTPVCNYPFDADDDTSDSFVDELLAAANDSQPLQECPGDLLWNDCGTACNNTCEDPQPACTRQCVQRCECPKHTPIQLDSEAGLCGRTDQCEQHDCTGDQTWMECGSGCTPTCDDPSPLCTLSCVKRCQCPAETPIHVDDERGLCGTLDTCTEQDHACAGDQVWKNCGSACNRTCVEPSPACTRQCVARCECPTEMPIQIDAHTGLCGILQDCNLHEVNNSDAEIGFSEAAEGVEVLEGVFEIKHEVTDDGYLMLRLTYAFYQEWVGLCIAEQTSGSMPGCDILMVAVDGQGNAEVKDMYTLEYATPIEDQSQDWELVHSYITDSSIIGSTVAGTTATVIVQRKLHTNDGQDRPIVQGDMLLAWAYGTKPFYYHGSKRGIFSATFIPLQNQPNIISVGDDVYTLDALADFEIPEKDTTYAITTFQVPSDVKDGHIIQHEVVVTPGNEQYVHHMLVYSCRANSRIVQRNGSIRTTMEANDTPLGDENCVSMITGWAIGGPLKLPTDTAAGIPIGWDVKIPTEFIVIEIHYDNPNRRAGIHDTSGIRLYVTNTKRKYDAQMLHIGDAFTQLRPMPRADYIHQEVSCPRDCIDFQQPVTIQSITLHMHNYGIRALLTRTDVNGNVEELMRIDHWAFDAQRTIVARNQTIYPSDKLTVHCTFNTTSSPNSNVRFAESTQDEMCMAFVLYYPAQFTPFGGPFGQCGIFHMEGEYLDVCGSMADTFISRLRPTKPFPLKEPDPPGCQSIAFGKPDLIPQPVCNHSLDTRGLPADFVTSITQQYENATKDHDEDDTPNVVDQHSWRKPYEENNWPPIPTYKCGSHTMNVLRGSAVHVYGSSYNIEIRNVIDGNPKSTWASQTSVSTTHWISFKLNAPVHACQLRVLWGQAMQSTSTVSVFTRQKVGSRQVRRWYENAAVQGSRWSQFRISGTVQQLGIRTERGTSVFHIAEVHLFIQSPEAQT